jgi:hypothetical protein
MMDLNREHCVAESFYAEKLQWTGLGDFRSDVQAMNRIKRILLEIERKVPSVLRHPYWKNRRIGWSKDLKKSHCLKDISKQMLQLASSIKLVCFKTVWLASTKENQVYDPCQLEDEDVNWIGYPPDKTSVFVYSNWENEVKSSSALRLSALAMQLQILHASLNWNELKVSIIISL